ncbi:MAG: hypothetical protein ACOCZZ_01655 [Bacillota bacterium]
MKKDRSIPFIITSSYLLTFIFIRLAVIIAGSAGSAASQAVKDGELMFYVGTNVVLFGYHIHHLFFGILLICLAGWFAITGSNYFSKRDTALMYGIGMGLFMDEIGLILSWGDYWSSTTYLLVLLLAGIFLNIVYFPDFWADVRGQLSQVDPKRMTSLSASKSFVLRRVDIVAEETSNTSKVSLTFSGLLYIVVGVLVLAFPELVYYWVAGGFLLQGLTSLVQAWKT